MKHPSSFALCFALNKCPVKSACYSKRTIQTTSDAMIDLANPRPDKVDKELPIETGLATLFEALRDMPVEKPKSVTLVRK